MKLPRLSFQHFVLALIVSILAVLISSISPFDTLEKRLLDFSFQIRGAEPASPDIVIIEINDQSLKRLGTWPWPRSYHGQILKILNTAKPSVIFFDMIFSEKSNLQHDQLLAGAIQEAGNVVLAYYFPAAQPKEMKLPDALPIPLLREHAKALGFVNSFPDADGYVRRYVLRFVYEGKSYYHSTLAVLVVHLGWSQEKLDSFPFDGTMINFPGPYNQFRILPYEEIVASWGHPWGKPLYESLRGKIILIGHTATGTAMDLKPTAFSNQYPGVGMQASMIHTLLTGKFIHRLPFYFHIPFLLLFLLLVILVTENKRPAKGFWLTSAALLLVFQLVQVLFIYGRIWIPFGTFFVTSILVYMTVTLYNFVKVHFEKEIFSRELSLATRIQSNFLTTQMPQIQGLQVAAVTIPARHVGGDLYDVIIFENGKCGICVGDVSGKGVPAALFMAKAISEFRREIHAITPAAVVKNLNLRLSEGGFSGLFITLLYMVVDPVTRQFIFSNGGHEPIFYYQKHKNAVDLLMTDQGGPLGIDPEGVFDQKEGAASPGDILLLESDGIKEAMNSKREIFGLERVKAAILEAADKSPQEIIDHLQRRIGEFVKNAPQHDDMTIVCAKFV